MTLLLQSCFSDSKTFGDGFIVATADTRVVYKQFNPFTLKPGEEITHSTEVYDKSIKLTNNVILCAGGLESVTDHWKAFMLECSKDKYFLDDMEPIMQESRLFLKEEAKSNSIIKKYMDTEFVTLRLVGFFKNGNTGVLKMMTDGTIEKTEIPSDSYLNLMFAPTEEIYDNKDTLMDFTQFSYGVEGMLTNVVNHLLYCHALVASQETENVSNTCIVHVLAKVNGEIVHNQLEFDLTQTIEEIQNVS